MKIFLLVFILFISISSLFGQDKNERSIFVVDEIPVWKDPKRGDEVLQTDIDEVKIVKNRDSLKISGFEKFDAAIYIYTKEYRKRSDDVRQIPSTKLMTQKNGVWMFQNKIYTGKFIDYYWSGKKKSEGTFKDGVLDGLSTKYFTNGLKSAEIYFKNDIASGLETKYYPDGSVKEKVEFIDGKEEGIWESYFPNGQVKLRSIFKNGVAVDSGMLYYSSGLLKEKAVIKNGKVIHDKKNEKINKLIEILKDFNQNGDDKGALKTLSKILEIDSLYAEAYSSIGSIKLNEMKFDEAIENYNTALRLEPYFEDALANRAFARIRKYQFGRVLKDNKEVTVITTKTKTEIPENEKIFICNDLKKAILLGNNTDIVLDAEKEYCKQ